MFIVKIVSNKQQIDITDAHFVINNQKVLKMMCLKIIILIRQKKLQKIKSENKMVNILGKYSKKEKNIFKMLKVKKINGADRKSNLFCYIKKILSMFEDSLLKYRKYIIDLYSLAKKTQQKKLLYGAKNSRTNQQVIKEIQQQILTSLPQPIISPQLISILTDLQIVLPTKKTHKTKINISPLSQLSSILPYMQSICSQLNVRIEGQMPDTFLINGQKISIDSRIGNLAGKSIKVQGIPIELNVYCYTYNWENGKATNFYSCKTCKNKWVCQNCSLLCHKNHDLALQLKNHKADWACCYCVTKCDCKAINKSSKIKM